MLIIHVNPAGIEKITLDVDDYPWTDLCLAVWPIVAHHLAKLHRDLRAVSYAWLMTEGGGGTILTNSELYRERK